MEPGRRAVEHVGAARRVAQEVVVARPVAHVEVPVHRHVASRAPHGVDEVHRLRRDDDPVLVAVEHERGRADRAGRRDRRGARDRAAEHQALLHAIVVARRQAHPLHRHRPEALGARRGDGHGEGDGQRPVDGAHAHDEPGLEPGFAVDRVREAPELALQGRDGGERRDRAVAPGDGWPRRRDVAGVGREWQVPLVLRVHRLRPQVAVARHVELRP